MELKFFNPKRAAETVSMIAAIGAILAGHHSYIQGVVLADLLAMWLAGHRDITDRELTEKMREDLLQEHIKAVRQFIPDNEKILEQRFTGRPSPQKFDA